MATTTIIAAANFRVEQINVRIQLDAHRWTFVKGFGIRDLAANALVSLNSRFEGIAVPTAYGQRSTAEAAISGGLIAGYKTV